MPGALGQPQEAGAIIDHRYLWDPAGNLSYVQHSEGAPRTSAYAYDEQDRLIVAQTKADEVQASSDAKVQPVSTTGNTNGSTAGPSNNEAKPVQLEQYFYDAQGRRVLAQTSGVTSKTRFDKASHRWVQDGSSKDNSTQASYDQAGQPQAMGSKTYQWDAGGRLIKTTDGSNQTSYAYDHRGLRNTKHIGQASAQQTTHYLHDEGKNIVAELDAQGNIKRQYVHLADQPLATIDTPSGQRLSSAQTSQLSQVMQDITTIIHGWISSSKDEQITWLHLNHLGAPEAATDSTASVVWQASYQSFGKATVKAARYQLNIRLPGQYEDQESGLHYNRQRYYDPAKGSYLTPDPSGNPDGANSYAYVRYNPVKYVDPDGLVLFAFDGTGNTNNAGDLATLNSSESNVWQFHQLYQSGNGRYVTGVGTRHREPDQAQFGADVTLWATDTSIADMASNYTGPQRIQRMMAYFNAEMELEREDSRLLDIDIVGFSRGAAQARDFANLINANTRNGQYNYSIFDAEGNETQRCQMINFRFMGLWDTVLSTNVSRNYNMAIVPGFQHVAQAVALNEYRGGASSLTGGRRLPDSRGNFPLESITGRAAPFGQERVERGFIGAHADIGGGFSAGDDSAMARVSLAWMIEQARDAGVTMNDPRTDIPASVVIHDKSDNQYCTNGPGCSEDRTIVGGAGGTQRRMTGTGMTYADTGQFVTYNPPSILADGSIRREPGPGFTTGQVDMTRYLAWLRSNGYDLGNLQVQ
jgi:RHS repeat-associated protein